MGIFFLFVGKKKEKKLFLLFLNLFTRRFERVGGSFARRRRRVPVSFSLAPCDCSLRIWSALRLHTRDPPQTGFVLARVRPVADSSASNVPFTSNDESTGKCLPSCMTAVSSYTVVPEPAAAATMTGQTTPHAGSIGFSAFLLGRRRRRRRRRECVGTRDFLPLPRPATHGGGARRNVGEIF